MMEKNHSNKPLSITLQGRVAILLGLDPHLMLEIFDSEEQVRTYLSVLNPEDFPPGMEKVKKLVYQTEDWEDIDTEDLEDIDTEDWEDIDTEEPEDIEEDYISESEQTEKTTLDKYEDILNKFNGKFPNIFTSSFYRRSGEPANDFVDRTLERLSKQGKINIDKINDEDLKTLYEIADYNDTEYEKFIDKIVEYKNKTKDR